MSIFCNDQVLYTKILFLITNHVIKTIASTKPPKRDEVTNMSLEKYLKLHYKWPDSIKKNLHRQSIELVLL